MPRVVHPRFVPDPAASRAEMEALQREIADCAVFADRFDFDPTRIGPAQSTTAPGTDDLSTDSEADDTTTDQTTGDASTDPTTDDTATGQTGVGEPGDEGRTGRTSAGDSGEDAPVVAGVDQAFTDERAVSAVVAWRRGTVVERVHAARETEIPYVPGLLSFREGRSILAAVEELSVEPDVWLFDGSGRIHFRQAGLATHVGVTLDAPAVGVAKSLLCGRLAAETDGRPVGWREPVTADDSMDAPDDTVVGYAYQSRQFDNRPVVNPLYVSPGHRVSAETAVAVVARSCAGYKLPEPTRLADAYADELTADE